MAVREPGARPGSAAWHEERIRTESLSDRIRVQLIERLPAIFGAEVQILSLALLPGGASKEAWAVDISLGGSTLELLVRRATGGSVFADMLTIEDEYRVLCAAAAAHVAVPKPHGYIADLADRDALVMARVKGETIGRRIVRQPEFDVARAALPAQMATQLARIHSIPLPQTSFVPGPQNAPAIDATLDSLEAQLDSLLEPHPAIELGLRWLREHPPASTDLVLVHADFRLGNLMIDPDGLVAVLDWELARRGDPAEDLGWALVRAWRFGHNTLRLGGIGHAEPFLEHYNALTGRVVTLEDLFYWELAGNVRWAIGSIRQAIRHLSGEELSVELAILGRLAAEVEYEVLTLLEQVA
jgi:aminoglycoside phosphotransferase (APT) family kinase protein